MTIQSCRRTHANHNVQNTIAILVGPLGQGGSGKTIVQQTAAFTALGYHVDLLILARDSPWLHAIPENVHLHCLGSLHPVWGIFPLLRYIRQTRPQAVLVHRLRLLRPLLSARTLARVPCRIVAVIHTHLGMQLAGDRGKPHRRLRRLRDCDAFVAVSKELARDTAERLGLPPAAIRVAYPPVDHDALRALAATAPPMQLPTRYLIAIGRLEEQKDFATLFRAFARVHQKNRELDLVVLGEGRERHNLEQLAIELGIADRVQLPGFIPNPYPWIASAQLLALSSRLEGFGMVLAEALTLGIPVVATDCPNGPREILDGGRYGRLVPPGDPEALAMAILATIAEPAAAERLRQAAERYKPAASTQIYLESMGIAPATADQLTVHRSSANRT